MRSCSDDDKRLPGPGGMNRQNPYKFNADEVKVLKECNRDSFFMRCIPIGTAMGVATYMGVNSGYLKGGKYGATPKVIVAVIMGYFIGKVSYQKKCAERLMQLPNSPIGDMLRQRKKGFFQENLEPGLGPSMSLAPFSGLGNADQYSDLAPSSDIDTSRPEYDGLDDSFRPSIDSNPIYEEDMPPVQKQVTSYDELRKKNRDEYQQSRTSNYSRDAAPLTNTTRSTEPAAEKPLPPPRTNKYGDAVI